MKYRVQWIEKNMGITRKTIRYYEDKGLLDKNNYQSNDIDSNKYREFSKDDLYKIWTIKFLINIGYTANDVYNLMYDSKFELFESLSKKIEELEKELCVKQENLKLLKKIWITGYMPQPSKIGNNTFDTCVSYIKTNWNTGLEDTLIQNMEMSYAYLKKDEGKLDDFMNDEDFISKLTEISKNVYSYKFQSYYDVLISLSYLDYNSREIQTILNIIYEQFKIPWMVNNDEVCTKEMFASNLISLPEQSLLKKTMILEVGEEKVNYFYNALQYFVEN